MRLIDADALTKKALDEAFFDSAAEDTFCELVETAPTVYAVEVVRCKDCKYLFLEHRYWCEIETYCGRNYERVCDCHYCGYGERREP